ncbi:hypothetical protein ACFXHA_10420 [Nocardia sp. NPDC059240]|uniref:hypothetical protein n=1 Tax=Nocardia sp. NPDC059240 TaxID=3346786 RepID=UPI0036C1A175
MFHPHLPRVAILAAAASAVVAAGLAGADTPASVTVETQLAYQVTTLTINGTATCQGGGTAGVTVVDGSLDQMFEGGIGGPIAIQLDGPVLVNCDGSLQHWSGNLVAPGRVLPNSSGGQLTVNLSQGQTTLATTGPHPAYIVR